MAVLRIGAVAAHFGRDLEFDLQRIATLIDYDKTFPESARSLALDGAEIVACLSAWPTSITNRAPRMAQDRQSRLFDLYDQARAAENQVMLASANQTGESCTPSHSPRRSPRRVRGRDRVDPGSGRGQ
jgi:predicted amidohydrolase